MSERVEYYKDDSEGEEWRWRVVSGAGRVIGKSTEGYTRKENAIKNFNSLPDYCDKDGVRTASAGRSGPLEFYEDEESKWRWRITASNGEIVHASVAGHDDIDGAKANLTELLVWAGG